MAATGSSPQPSPCGKRRMFRKQESVSEPPRKSPAADIANQPMSSFEFSDNHMTSNVISPPSPIEESCEVQGLKSFSPQQRRHIKRATRRTQSPSPTPPRHGSRGSWDQKVLQEGCAINGVQSGLFDSCVVKEEDRFADMNTRNYQCSGGGGSGGGSRGKFTRMNSKDIMDEYHRSRRRSSCKEITLQFLPHVFGATVENESDHPLYRAVESHRRLSTGQQSLSRYSPHSSSSPAGGHSPHRRLSVQAGSAARSHSADGYDDEDWRDRRQDTQALLFDSTPDLTVEDNYIRFPCLRSQRRGAVCYTETDATLTMLSKLNLGTDDD